MADGRTAAPAFLILAVRSQLAGTELMSESKPTTAQQVAQAALAFQQQSTGYVPKSVTVILSEDTLVITFRGALTPAEKALAQSPRGAVQVQEYHRQLFNDSCGSLRREIARLTGAEVREATAEIETRAGGVVQVFTTGTMVQLFLLSQRVPAETWSSNGRSDAPAGAGSPGKE